MLMYRSVYAYYVYHLFMCYAVATPYEICSPDVDWSELSDDSSDLNYYCNYPYLPVSGSEGMIYYQYLLAVCYVVKPCNYFYAVSQLKWCQNSYLFKYHNITQQSYVSF